MFSLMPHFGRQAGGCRDTLGNTVSNTLWRHHGRKSANGRFTRLLENKLAFSCERHSYSWLRRLTFFIPQTEMELGKATNRTMFFLLCFHVKTFVRFPSYCFFRKSWKKSGDTFYLFVTFFSLSIYSERADLLWQ